MKCANCEQESPEPTLWLMFVGHTFSEVFCKRCACYLIDYRKRRLKDDAAQQK